MRDDRLAGTSGPRSMPRPSNNRSAAACIARQLEQAARWASSSGSGAPPPSPSSRCCRASWNSGQFMFDLGDHAAPPQALEHFQPRPMQPGLDRTHRALECLGYFLIRLTLLVEKDKNCSVLLTQLFLGSLDL